MLPLQCISYRRLSTMETATAENSHSSASSGDVDHHPENSVSDIPNDEDMELKHNVTEEEAISIMEVIAFTGKFWHDWDMLKSILSSRLKQVLAEYPESQMPDEFVGPQQSSLLGETYLELVKRLDEALLIFTEGPPFTLQRLCEILLAPQSIYPNLSKLALALEKNLLVTSTLTKCNDPYPSTTVQKPGDPNKIGDEVQPAPIPTQNGIESTPDNGDEEMADAEVEEDKIYEDNNDKIYEDNNEVETVSTEERPIETSMGLEAAAAVEAPSVDPSPSSEHVSPKTT